MKKFHIDASEQCCYNTEHHDYAYSIYEYWTYEEKPISELYAISRQIENKNVILFMQIFKGMNIE